MIPIQAFAKLAISHLAVAALAFLLGLYSLPILIAPADPSPGTLALSIKNTRYLATIAEDVEGSDWLHWGKGRFSIGDDYIVFQGKLSPGPAYRLYLSPQFVATEDEFLRLKSSMIAIGEINSFANSVLAIKQSINIEDYNSVIIWCEAFNQFITAAQFKY